MKSVVSIIICCAHTSNLVCTINLLIFSTNQWKVSTIARVSRMNIQTACMHTCQCLLTIWKLVSPAPPEANRPCS